jgi:hypothetical protein
MNEGGIWRVFYTERGKDDDPIFESTSEEEACEFFFKYQTEQIQHLHLVGFFHSEEKAKELVSKLEEDGIQARQDKIPYGGWADPRYRVFVVEKDIFKTRELLGKMPVED